MKVSREKEGGKTNIVCVYIYGFPYGRGGKGQNEKKIEPPPSPRPPIYSPPICIDGLAFFLVVLLYASMIWMVHK